MKGTISPGKLADFVVLGEDPLTIDKDGIGQISVDATIVGGNVATTFLECELGEQMTYDYPHLTVTVRDGVATVLIDNPPINLMTSGLFRSLAKVSVDLSKDDEVRVVVLRRRTPSSLLLTLM